VLRNHTIVNVLTLELVMERCGRTARWSSEAVPSG